MQIEQLFSNIEEKLIPQEKAIEQAAQILGDVMLNNGIVQLFGLGHGESFSMELGYRAGGLMPYHKMSLIDLILQGHYSKDTSIETIQHDASSATKLYNAYQIEPQDAFILISDDHQAPILLALLELIKAKQHRVILVTSKPTTLEFESLFDGILYTHIDSGDHYSSQQATIIRNVLAQLLTIKIYNYLKDQKVEPPVLLSANLAGADVHNRKLSDRYKGRWES